MSAAWPLPVVSSPPSDASWRQFARHDGLPPICVGPLRIDREARAVTLAGRRVALTRLEYELLCHLASSPQRVFTRAELLGAVWGFRAAPRTRTVDTHASRLRVKLAGVGGPWLVNTWGVGYALCRAPPPPH